MIYFIINFLFSRYPDLPCIDLGRESYLPMEFCRTVLKYKKKLTDGETADLIKKTAVKAPERMAYIESWANKSAIDKDPILKEYNINVNLRLVEVDGRVLNAPDVQYAGNNVANSRSIGERGSWRHDNFKLVNGVNVNRWVALNFSGRVRDQSAYDFCMNLSRVGKIHGLNIAEPLDYAEPRNVRNATPEDARRLFEDMVTKHKPLDLILVIMGGTTQIYNMIKTCGKCLI